MGEIPKVDIQTVNPQEDGHLRVFWSELAKNSKNKLYGPGKQLEMLLEGRHNMAALPDVSKVSFKVCDLRPITVRLCNLSLQINLQPKILASVVETEKFYNYFVFLLRIYNLFRY